MGGAGSIEPKAGRIDREYRNWLHDQPCCITGRRPVIMHHIRDGFYCLGKKPDDRFAVPMIEELHLEGHRGGWKTFERRYRICLLDLAREYWDDFQNKKGLDDSVDPSGLRCPV